MLTKNIFFRVLSITAPDDETILEIVKEILPNLADVSNLDCYIVNSYLLLGGLLFIKYVCQGGPKGGNNEDLDVRLLIHQSRAGCVIGKAGAKIKELREVSVVALKFERNYGEGQMQRRRRARAASHLPRAQLFVNKFLSRYSEHVVVGDEAQMYKQLSSQISGFIRSTEFLNNEHYYQTFLI